jgi:hypothetical protein
VSRLAARLAGRGRFLAAWAGALVLGTGAFLLADLSWRALPHPRPLEELSYYPSGRSLEPATLGHAATAADLAWLRAVQYYGQHRTSDNQFARMGHVFDILTTLDPSFLPAYVFGAFALAQPTAAAAALTIVVGIGFLLAGGARIWLGVALPAGPRAYVVFAGVVTLLLGVLILAGWPGNTLFVLGTLFGVDMVFYGASWIGLGLKLRR